MKPERILDCAIYPAMDLLPVAMRSPSAVAMMLAIGMQESMLRHRRQVLGSARGYWQFESAGVSGVVNHSTTVNHVHTVLGYLDYDIDYDASRCYVAIEHNDVLAAAFARLLLWTLPQALPQPDDPEEGWQQYMSAWRPGKPQRATWDDFFEQGWQLASET